jgi:hypothetical protein
MFTQRYYRGIVDAASQPAERKAISNTTPLTSALGNYQGRKTVYDLGRNNQVLNTQLNLDNQKRDIKEANKDAKFATAIGVGNVALTGASVYQKMLDAAENAHLAAKQEEFYSAINEMLTQNKEYYHNILRNGAPKEAEPLSDIESGMLEAGV